MSYRLHLEPPLADELRRVAREQLQHAADDLATHTAGLDYAVHQARKRCKKVRGLLRLARDPLGRDYPRLNARLRDTARSLSRLRDAAALITALDALVATTDDEELEDAAAELRRHLEHEREQVATEQDLPTLAATAAATLRQAARQVEIWPLDQDLTIDDLLPGLARTYGRGREALPRARDGDPEAVHEWRKRCKYLWYHVRLLTTAWPRPLAAVATELSTLSTVLGEHHDLANLQRVVAEHDEDAAMDADSVQALETAIRVRSAQLLATALPQGERIWNEKPKPFVKRIRAYWTAWEAESQPQFHPAW